MTEKAEGSGHRDDRTRSGLFTTVFPSIHLPDDHPSFLPTTTMSFPFPILIAILSILFLSKNFIRLIVRQRLSPLRLLPGPYSPSFFMGNLAEMHEQENNGLIERWAKRYGSTFSYRGFIGGYVSSLPGSCYRYLAGTGAV